MFSFSKLLHLNQAVFKKDGFYPIEKTEVLVNEHTNIIKRIDAIIGLSTETFHEYHLNVICNFANLIQRMPSNDSDHLLIKKTLNQYVTLLKQPSIQSINSIVLSDNLLNFALLIAVLSHIASQAFRQTDLYYKNHDENLILWHPFDGFIDLGCQYRYQPKDPNTQNIANELDRILFFNLLLTKNGYAWIVRDNLITTQMNYFLSSNHCENLFDSLIKKLDTQEDSKTHIGFILRDNFTKEQGDISYLTDSTMGGPTERKAEISTTAANTSHKKQHPKKELFPQPSLRYEIIEEYKRWLNNSIEKGSLRINRPNERLHIVNEGLLLITPGIFQDYEKTSAISWKKLQNAILKSRWHIQDSKKNNFLTYSFQGVTKISLLKGIVIKDPTRLLTGTLPHPNPKITLINF